MRLRPRLNSYTEYFLFLLPVFFVLHGYSDNYGSVLLPDAFELTGIYILAAIGLCSFFFLFFRSRRKACLYSFFLLSFHFFFGSLHDAAIYFFPRAFFVKYIFILPASFILFLVYFVFLKRSKRTFNELARYLNTLLLIFLLLEAGRFVIKIINFETPKISSSFTVCDTCAKPDVYLIIADEYADSSSLSEVFHFNNTIFQNELRGLGFHIIQNSRSNYNFTPFAMASIFKMDYLQNLDGGKRSKKDLNSCYNTINKNELINFFKTNGYAIKNFSIFNLDNQPKKATLHDIVVGKELITSHTFLQRLYKDLGFHLVTTFKLQFVINRSVFYTKQSNEKLLGLLNEEMQANANQPRFIYTHLMMPHFPYYFDKNGNERPIELLREGNEYDKKAYAEYLQYGNNVYLELIRRILNKSKTPPIILFMGDHGFRWFSNKMTENNYLYRNFNSVYLPNKNYSGFYDGLSGVNQFRVLLNTYFGQQLPLLKDSSRFIRE